MANEINVVSLVGRLVRDADVFDHSTFQVANFSLATNYNKKVNGEWTEDVSFIDCAMYNPKGVAEFLVKGKQVAIQGSIRQDRWVHEDQKRSKVTIIVDRLQLIGNSSEAKSLIAAPSEQFRVPNDDHIPF